MYHSYLSRMNASSPITDPTSLKWYCLRCQPRMESLAAANLRVMPDVEVFYPQTSVIQKTSEGKRHMRKPLFPGYIFCSFDPIQSMRMVNYSQGVSYIVRHGIDPVEVLPEIIKELMAVTKDEVLDVPSAKPIIGQSVRVLHGLFEGKEGKVMKLIPERQRVQVLLEILGAISKVEVDEDFVDAGDSHPMIAN
jgi:transcription elongation factor/antiterminator RfaH